MIARPRIILVVDVVDSTGLLLTGEGLSEGRLARAMQSVRSHCVKRGGQEFFSAGDGIGFFFAETDTAASAAVDLGEAAADGSLGVHVRMGLHAGDVTKIGNAYFGLAINIAARVQAEATPNALFATADGVRDLSAAFVVTPLGERALKGFTDSVPMFHVGRAEAAGLRSGRGATPTASAPEMMPGRIAVLPFVSLTEDSRWRYLADGFTEDLTTNLCRFKSIAVIAPRSSAAAAAEMQTPRDAGRILGAAYVVSGHIHAGEGRLRVTASLMDVATETQIWGHRFDESAGDLFALNDRLTDQLAAHLVSQVEHSEMRRVRSARVETLESFELLLRGFEALYRYTRKDNRAARECFRKSVRLSPSYARAYAATSKTYNLEWRYRWVKYPERALETALELASLAVEIDSLDPRGHSELGFAHLYRSELDLSLSSYSDALELNPNDPDVIVEYADAVIYDGRPEETVGLVQRAMLFNPSVPDRYFWTLGGAYHQLGEYDLAVSTLKRMKNPSEAARLLASSCAHAGHRDEARAWAEAVLRKHPTFSTDQWSGTQPFRNETDRRRFTDGLRLAGLP